MGRRRGGIGKLGPLVAAALLLGFVASSAWLAVLMPRNGFSSPPPGTVWTRDQLVAALDDGAVLALLPTGDQGSDIVARTRNDGLVVNRASAFDPTGSSGTEDVISELTSTGQADLLVAGRNDTALVTYARAVARIVAPNATMPVIAWWISLLGGLSMVMYWAAGRTSFRFSAPFGPFGVGTERSP
jgi:hypothetical protein